MDVKGNYTLSSFFTKAEGPFTIVLKDVFVKGNASLAVERDGRIRTKEIKMDITFRDMAVDFQNLGISFQSFTLQLWIIIIRFFIRLGFFASIFQSFINSAPTLVFDAIKPLLLSEAYVQISQEIDSNIEKLAGDHRFPNSISPLDMVTLYQMQQYIIIKLSTIHLGYRWCTKKGTSPRIRSIQSQGLQSHSRLIRNENDKHVDHRNIVILSGRWHSCWCRQFNNVGGYANRNAKNIRN